MRGFPIRESRKDKQVDGFSVFFAVMTMLTHLRFARFCSRQRWNVRRYASHKHAVVFREAFRPFINGSSFKAITLFGDSLPVTLIFGQRQEAEERQGDVRSS